MTDTTQAAAASNNRWKDALERITWTAAQAIVATVSIEMLDLPAHWIIPATIALAALKNLVAGHFGNPGTSAIGPGGM